MALFGEVIAGTRRCAYKKSDGLHRMAGNAHGALEREGITVQVTDPEEQVELEASAPRPCEPTARAPDMCLCDT